MRRAEYREMLIVKNKGVWCRENIVVKDVTFRHLFPHIL